MMSSRSALALFRHLSNQSRFQITRLMSSGEKGIPGEGAGAGGGAGGTIREAGGSFGKREAALEEQYMREQQKESINKMKENLKKNGEEKACETESSEKASDEKSSAAGTHLPPKGKGATKAAGGVFAKRKTALEDQYFKNKESKKDD